MKRLFDIVASLVGLVILLPFLILFSLLVLLGSRGGVFYVQERIGRHGVPFCMYKFRTMRPGSDKAGLLTIGADSRVTGFGHFLRKYKLDELPQLFNVLKGDMSIIGPRPEVAKYVALYSEEQRRILSIRPGLSDNAALDFIDESKELAKHDDPEKAYIEVLLPQKLELYLDYVDNRSFWGDMVIILRTLAKIVR